MAFGAVEIQRWTADDGRIGHAELALAGEVLSVWDADATVAKAVGAGAGIERPVTMRADGARSGWIVDPFGHRWNVQTPGEHVSVEQLRDRVGDQYDITD
ncbi:VOC family protein [Pilimelia columellifera]|uniref:VOC family protein n=1 Tax=Pilimelia columellifera TaxID=706574 RepID=UPI0031DA822D